MELFETNNYYIIVNGTVALFCDRLSGHINLEKSIELPYEWNPVCLGQIQGIIGKINFAIDGESKLILINKIESVGILPIIGHVHRVSKISILSINVQPISNLDIDLCPRHHFGLRKTEKITTSPDASKPIFKAFQEHMKSAAESVKPRPKDLRDKEKFEKRMLEEFDKMFHDGTNSTDCFYISIDPNKSCDITSNIQRQNCERYSMSVPLWQRADDRFFWNKAMLKEAIDSADQLLIQTFGKCVFQTNNELSEADISLSNIMIRDIEGMLMPIIEGFVQVEPFDLQIPTHSPISANVPNLPQSYIKHEYKLKVALISRRNRYRTGTRFRRRGVDADGNVANYVETEQILRVENDKSPHIVSFLQVRGSVPVFWSQFSLKYRPPIILEKSDVDNQAAFQKHFATEFELYDKVVVVNLVDTGLERSERKISDAYLYHLIKLNSPKITCVMFDFHDYCSGLQFDNVSILIKGVTELFRDMKYAWVDKNGMICKQKSIFRVNCIDCLDRTNVVQCMLAGVVIETQLRKLGLLSPEESLPNNFHQIMLFMWANNGDAISRQYSGTAAMKGDFTRTGTRTVNGLVKDGVSSVNRYYLRLKEMSRQAALDLMTGNDNSAEITSIRNGRSDTEQKLMKQKEDNIKELIAQCKKECLKNDEECLTESILIYCYENEKEFHDMNTVVLITSKTVYFISNLLPLPKNRIKFQKSHKLLAIALPLQRIRKIQIGYEPMLFRSNEPMVRIFYDRPMSTTGSTSITKAVLDNSMVSTNENMSDGNCLTFRQPSLRLFNNLLIEVKKHDDMVESLGAVAESFYLAAKTSNPNVHFDKTITKFEKVKCKAIPRKWIFQVDIDAIYENIVTSSSFTELNYGYHEMMHIEEDVSDGPEPNDPTLIEEDNIVKEIGVLKPIDMIKHGINKFKDKVKISYLKDRFTTFSSRGSDILNSKQDTLKENNNFIESERKESFDIGYRTVDETDHLISSSLKNEIKPFTFRSEYRWFSMSDDEILRRNIDQFSDFDIRNTKSDLMKYTKCDTECKEEPNPNSSRGNVHCDNYTNEDAEQQSIAIFDQHKGTIANKTDHYSSYNNIEKWYKASNTDKDNTIEDIVLENCGIIKLTSKKSSFKNSNFSLLNINAQLIAATGCAYKRRAERISRQLSIDDSSTEAYILESINKSPLIIRRQDGQEKLRESRNISLSFSDDDCNEDVMDNSSVNIETIEDLIGYITMPHVVLDNAKMAERLTNKQMQLAFFVERLRKKLLYQSESIRSKMIIF